MLHMYSMPCNRPLCNTDPTRSLIEFAYRDSMPCRGDGPIHHVVAPVHFEACQSSLIGTACLKQYTLALSLLSALQAKVPAKVKLCYGLARVCVNET